MLIVLFWFPLLTCNEIVSLLRIRLQFYIIHVCIRFEILHNKSANKFHPYNLQLLCFWSLFYFRYLTNYTYMARDRIFQSQSVSVDLFACPIVMFYWNWNPLPCYFHCIYLFVFARSIWQAQKNGDERRRKPNCANEIQFQT